MDKIEGHGNRIEVYTDDAGETRWRWVAAENGEVLADSGQGYTDKRDALKAVARITGVGAISYLNGGEHVFTVEEWDDLRVVFL